MKKILYNKGINREKQQKESKMFKKLILIILIAFNISACDNVQQKAEYEEAQNYYFNCLDNGGSVENCRLDAFGE